MVIRPVTVRDREALFRLLRGRETFNQEEIRVAMEVIEEAIQHPEREDYEVFCAWEEEGLLAGYICFGPIPMTDHRYDLYWIVVEERFSGRGIGRKLLEFMEEVLARKGGNRIYIETSSTPPYRAARSLYRAAGYHVVAILKDFYRTKDHKIVFMKEIDTFPLEKGEEGTYNSSHRNLMGGVDGRSVVRGPDRPRKGPFRSPSYRKEARTIPCL